MAGQPETTPLILSVLFVLLFLNTWCLSQLQSVVMRHGGADSRSPCWFRLNSLKLIQKWQGSSSSFYRSVLVIFITQVCAKACVSHADGANCACSCRASWGQCDATCMCLCACLRIFVGSGQYHSKLNLKKFRAPLGYRGLVLGLNVSCFFRSLGTANGARGQSKLDQTEVADIITSQKIVGMCSAGPSWTPASVPAF